MAAWTTFGTRNYDSSWSWRIPSILQMLIPALVLPGLIMMPESPRYLISTERTEEARAFLVKYHGEGDVTSALAAFEFAEISGSIQVRLHYISLPSRLFERGLRLCLLKRRPFLHQSKISLSLCEKAILTLGFLSLRWSVSSKRPLHTGRCWPLQQTAKEHLSQSFWVSLTNGLARMLLDIISLQC